MNNEPVFVITSYSIHYTKLYDALARGIMVPIAVESFEMLAPPADLRQINWFDLVDWSGEDAHEGWSQTLQSLGKLVGRNNFV